MSDPTERWQDEITRLYRKKLAADAALDAALKQAVEEGRSYSTLGSLLGQSNSAVRLKANRRGWKQGRP